MKKKTTGKKLKQRLDDLIPIPSRKIIKADNEGYVMIKASVLSEINKIEERLIESEEKFRNIASNALDAIIMIDNDGNINYWNKAAETIFGYKSDDIYGKNLHEILTPPEFHDAQKKAFLKFQKTGEGDAIGKLLELNALKKDGTRFPIELNLSAVKIKNKWNSIGILRDITNRKQVEQMKNEFISIVNHELRTPLTSLRGSLGLIMGGVTGQLSEKTRQLLEIALKNTDRLIRLINDILDIEKIESGTMKFKLKPIEIVPLIEQTLEADKGYADKWNVKFILQEKVKAKINVDRDRLIQVITNLLSNAAKFSPSGEDIIISVTRQNKFIRVSVKDKGPGINENFKKKIFSKFAQADSSDTRRQEGTGLGLSISKAIIEKMDGTIDFESQEGEGSTFFFTLPEYIEPGLVCYETDDGIICKPHILICESNQDIARFLSLILKEKDFVTDIALNAYNAKMLLSQNKYAAMTLDINLPDQDGISFIHEIRKNKETSDLPIVVVSVLDKPDTNEIKENTLRIVEWLTKPIDENRLIKALKCAINKTIHQKLRIIHIEDDKDIISLVSSLVKDMADIIPVSTRQEAQEKINQENFDLMILDLKLPDGNGAELVPLLKKSRNKFIPIIVFSAYNVSQNISQEVNSVLIKTNISNETLRDTIISLIDQNSQKE